MERAEDVIQQRSYLEGFSGIGLSVGVEIHPFGLREFFKARSSTTAVPVDMSNGMLKLWYAN